MTTRAEIRINAAKKRLHIAKDGYSRSCDKMRAAMAAARDKHSHNINANERRIREARKALSMAELAAVGITPMKTIILWHPKYSGITEQRRYVVRVDRHGWTRLVPVGKTGRILMSRLDQLPPNRWSDVTVTDQVAA